MNLRKVNAVPIERDGTMPSAPIRNQAIRRIPKIATPNPESIDSKLVADGDAKGWKDQHPFMQLASPSNSYVLPLSGI